MRRSPGVYEREKTETAQHTFRTAHTVTLSMLAIALLPGRARLHETPTGNGFISTASRRKSDNKGGPRVRRLHLQLLLLPVRRLPITGFIPHLTKSRSIGLHELAAFLFLGYVDHA